MNKELIINIAGEDYKILFDNKAVVMAEKKLGKSLLGFLSIAGLDGTGMDLSKAPTMEELIILFHAGLNSGQHGISLQKAQQLYDIMQDNSEDYEAGAYMTILTNVIGAISIAFFGNKAAQ